MILAQLDGAFWSTPMGNLMQQLAAVAAIVGFIAAAVVSVGHVRKGAIPKAISTMLGTILVAAVLLNFSLVGTLLNLGSDLIGLFVQSGADMVTDVNDVR